MFLHNKKALHALFSQLDDTRIVASSNHILLLKFWCNDLPDSDLQ